MFDNKESTRENPKSSILAEVNRGILELLFHNAPVLLFKNMFYTNIWKGSKKAFSYTFIVGVSEEWIIDSIFGFFFLIIFSKLWAHLGFLFQKETKISEQ